MLSIQFLSLQPGPAVCEQVVGELDGLAEHNHLLAQPLLHLLVVLLLLLHLLKVGRIKLVYLKGLGHQVALHLVPEFPLRLVVLLGEQVQLPVFPGLLRQLLNPAAHSLGLLAGQLNQAPQGGSFANHLIFFLLESVLAGARPVLGLLLQGPQQALLLGEQAFQIPQLQLQLHNLCIPGLEQSVVLVPFELGGRLELGYGQLVVVGGLPDLLLQLQVFVNLVVNFLQQAVVAAQVLDEWILALF